MATVKKPIKKKEVKTTVVDKTSTGRKRDVSKDLKFDKSSKALTKDVKKVTRPYTTLATPDPNAMFPGDSIRYFPGQRGGVGVPYIRDVGGSGGLMGIDTETTDAGYARASRDKKNVRTYQDTLRVKANFEKDKNGGKVSKKAKSGTTIAKAKDGKWIQKATASIKRRGTEGKCTPITKPGCTGKARTLAKTFKKIAKSNKKK